MAWILLLVAGVFEVVWALAMKSSAGFTRPVPTMMTLGGMVVSFWCLALALRHLPLGTAYAIWTGVGAVGAFIVGVLWMGEVANPLRVVAILLILCGILLMAWSSAGH